MKLHLPLALRAALLGCFAAMAHITPAAAANLTWDPTHDTWSVGSPFSSDASFLQGDDVTFGPLNETTETVNLQGELEVGEMIVNAGAGNTYTFSGVGENLITSLAGLTVEDGTAVFSSPQVLPEGAKVDIDGGGRLKLGTGDDLCEFNLNFTLGGTGNGAAELELAGNNGMTILAGALTMKDGSVMRLSNTNYYPWYEMRGDLTVEGTVTVDVAAGMAGFNISGSYQGSGTIRITGESTWTMISLRTPGQYNLILDCIDAEVSLNNDTYANVMIPEHRAGGLSFAGSRASADVCADGEFYVTAVSNDVILKSLTGSGTALVSQGTVILEDGDFSGSMQVGESWQFSDATLVLGSSDAMSNAKSVNLSGGTACLASLALTDGLSSATLKKLTASEYSRLQVGRYRVQNGGSFAGTLEDGVSLTVGAGSTMDLAGARVAESGAAGIVGESGSTIRNLTLGAGMSLEASLAAGDAAVHLDHLTLADGGIIRMALTGSSAEGYTPLCSYTAGESMSSVLSAGKTVQLVLGDGSLPPLTVGASYVLISEVGDAVDADCFRLNYTNEGRTQYELLVEDGDLVLAVSGEPAAELSWDGGAEGYWDTAPDNMIWTSGDAPASFSTYDRVVFGTQTGVQTAVVHVDEAGVTSGTITVVGSTDYEISGGPICTVAQSGEGLTVGTPAEAFTGTLTLASANSWDGDTVINSGMVVVKDARALSDTTAHVRSGATLCLWLVSGESLAAAVQLDGGTVSAGGVDTRVEALGVSENGGILDGTAGTLEASIVSAAAEGELGVTGAVSLGTSSGSLKLGTLNLLGGQGTRVAVERLEADRLLAADAGSCLQASELMLTGSGTRMAGSVQAGVLTLGRATQATGAVAEIRHLSTATLRYTFLQTGATPLTLGSYSSSAAAGGAISIDLTAQAIACGDGTYTLLSLSGAGAESLDVSDFTLSSATLTQLGKEGEAELLVSGQTLLVTLSGLVPEIPDEPISPDEPITPEPPVAGFYESSVGAAASTNGRAGLRLADQATVAQAVQPGSDMDLLLTALDEAIGAGNMGAADGIAAQLSGASATTLGLAFAADAQRHMGSIRNRLTTMKVDAISAPAADPVTGPVPAKSNPVSAWVNAEGSYQTMEQSGSAPGYSMSSWGGTLGVEVSPLKNLSCGLALTALYGDLDADARDAASGDLDTCYISAFGQYRHSAWTHTLVASLGMSDISLDRTVSHSQGSYRTSGDTTGSSLGFLYELSYDIPLNGGATTIIQPLVNVSYLHTSVDGYTETGSDAALSYGKQSMDSVSLGLGGRVQSLAGESVFNRSALIEGRVLAKFNGGDRRSTASVGFANGIGLSGVESAEVGVFGVELGAGISIPLGGEAGSVFVDASYELYREYSNLNASVGYRLSF